MVHKTAAFKPPTPLIEREATQLDDARSESNQGNKTSKRKSLFEAGVNIGQYNLSFGEDREFSLIDNSKSCKRLDTAE